MKHLIIAFTTMFLSANIHAQPLSVKMYELTTKNESNGYVTNIVGKEINTFQVPKGVSSVKLSMQVMVKNYKNYILPNQIQLRVTTAGKTEEGNIHNRYWGTLYKDSLLISECYFPAGDYDISLVDQVHPDKVFAKRTISVKSNGEATNLTINGFSYDRNKFKIWTCKSVDEVNWKPIGQTNKISLGSCITFFFDSPDKIKNPGTMRWKLYKVEADGKETFLNQREQTSVKEEWRKMYYEECDELRTKGKYRIYFAVKNESEAYYGVRDKDYFATADINVE
ncbi:MAG: hypothetical protein ABI402_05225 [Ferruginibacter sp.]